MKTIKKTKDEWIFETNRGDLYHFTCHYPETNPEGTMDEILDVMEYVGLFDGIKNHSPIALSSS